MDLCSNVPLNISVRTNFGLFESDEDEEDSSFTVEPSKSMASPKRVSTYVKAADDTDKTDAIVDGLGSGCSHISQPSNTYSTNEPDSTEKTSRNHAKTTKSYVAPLDKLMNELEVRV
jgi:hypothetical protein